MRQFFCLFLIILCLSWVFLSCQSKDKTEVVFYDQAKEEPALKEIATKVDKPYYAYFLEHDTPNDMLPGKNCLVKITVSNMGTQPWLANENYKISYHWANPEEAELTYQSVRNPIKVEVQPGQSTTLNARVNAPTEEGQFILKWDMIKEEAFWFASQGSPTLDVVVRVKQFPNSFYKVEYLNNNLPTSMTAGKIVPVQVTIKNTGDGEWLGFGGVKLAYKWFKLDDTENALITDTVPLTKDLKPSDVLALDFSLRTPQDKGSYKLQIDMLQERIVWFSIKGQPTLDFDLTLN